MAAEKIVLSFEPAMSSRGFAYNDRKEGIAKPAQRSRRFVGTF